MANMYRQTGCGRICHIFLNPLMTFTIAKVVLSCGMQKCYTFMYLFAI